MSNQIIAARACMEEQKNVNSETRHPWDIILAWFAPLAYIIMIYSFLHQRPLSKVGQSWFFRHLYVMYHVVVKHAVSIN